MTARARHAVAIAALSAALSLCAGCAKDSTSVFVTVNADATVPPILILRTVVVPAGDQTRASTAERSSPYASDAADRPGPFVFPVDLSVTVDSSFAGAVVITVEGLDWDTRAVTARGSASGSVVAQKITAASLTLAPTAIDGGDGGTD